MEKNSNPDLRAYAVWVPKVGGREKDVPTATKFVPDARASHYWDADGVLLKSYRGALGINQDAWDVYLVYGPEARWDGETPPRPDYWMHQLNVKNAPELDGKSLAKAITDISSR